MPISNAVWTLYRVWGHDGSLLYVGRTTLKQLHERLSQARARCGASEIARVTLDFLPTRAALHDAEILAIRTERPRHNKMVLHPVGANAPGYKHAPRLSDQVVF